MAGIHRDRLRPHPLLGAFLLLLCLTPLSPARAKSYSLPDLQMQVVVTPDGDVQVEEQLTFSFKGKFGFAFRDIPLGPGHRVTSVDVSESGNSYRLFDSEEPGTFALENHADRVKVTWYYKARNEQRTFHLTYTLTGAVARHDDVAELYMKFVGDQWDRPIQRVLVDLQLPAVSIVRPLQAWGHGPLHGEIEVLDGGQVQFRVAPLPAHTFWEGRVLFPPEAVAGLTPSGAGMRADAIQEEEARQALEANRLRAADRLRLKSDAQHAVWQETWANRLWPLAVLLGLVALATWFMMWRSYGQPYPVAPITVHGEAPSRHPPAVVARLLSGTVGARALVATLLDLARRGYYSIEEKQSQRAGWFGSTIKETDYIFTVTGNPADLLPLEKELVTFVHGLVGQQRSFRMLDLKKAARGKSHKLRRWFEKWRRDISRTARHEGLLEPPPVRAMVLNLLCGFLIAAGGGVMTAITSSPAGVPAIIGGILQLILTASLTRQTQEGRRLYLGWKAFKNHIQQVSRSEKPVAKTSAEWEDYLIFAVVFGYHKPLSQVLEHSLHGSSRQAFPWFVMVPQGSGPAGIGGLADGITTMVGSVSSTMSSATGGSGGASGGGGGGAGGGGGGAG